MKRGARRLSFFLRSVRLRVFPVTAFRDGPMDLGLADSKMSLVQHSKAIKNSGNSISVLDIKYPIGTKRLK